VSDERIMPVLYSPLTMSAPSTPNARRANFSRLHGLCTFVPSTKGGSVERVEVVVEQSHLERYGRARSTMKNCGFEPQFGHRDLHLAQPVAYLLLDDHAASSPQSYAARSVCPLRHRWRHVETTSVTA
jgi:hypothetical protein